MLPRFERISHSICFTSPFTCLCVCVCVDVYACVCVYMCVVVGMHSPVGLVRGLHYYYYYYLTQRLLLPAVITERACSFVLHKT
ncbi:unnamed protein product [Boreogadus saida]